MTQKDRPDGEKGLGTADLLGAQQLRMGQLATAVTGAQLGLPFFCRGFLSGGSGEGDGREMRGRRRRWRRGRMAGYDEGGNQEYMSYQNSPYFQVNNY
jgi:hypothetical protein